MSESSPFDAFDEAPASDLGFDASPAGDLGFDVDDGAMGFGFDDAPVDVEDSEPIMLGNDVPFMPEESTADAFGESTAFGESAPDTFGSYEVPETKNEELAFGVEEPVFAPEPTALSLWEEKRAVELMERQQKFVELKQEALSKAQEDIKQFYQSKAEKLEKTKQDNRDDEKNFLVDMENLMKFGSRWEKVNKLVNLAPSAAETGGHGQDRMRKLLIQLKNDKDE